MSRPRKESSSSRGKGHCGTPGCHEDRAPGHFLCSNHLPSIARIKDQIEREIKERGIFGQRSDNKDRAIREAKQNRSPRTPTCCWVGCFEPRFAGKNYCEFHLEQEENLNDEEAIA